MSVLNIQPAILFDPPKVVRQNQEAAAPQMMNGLRNTIKTALMTTYAPGHPVVINLAAMTMPAMPEIIKELSEAGWTATAEIGTYSDGNAQVVLTLTERFSGRPS